MELTEAEWMARHPLGYVEQREAFSPKGEYGKWLRGHNALAEIGGEIFLHGGIHPDLAKMKVDALNKPDSRGNQAVRCDQTVSAG